MNKEISMSFENKLNKIGEIQRSIFEELRARLTEMGEQNFLYDEDDEAEDYTAVPIDYVTDNGDNEVLSIDKIKVGDDGVLIHDCDFDEWHRLIELSNSDINALIGYIDWK
jgi:hypothetical protein